MSSQSRRGRPPRSERPTGASRRELLDAAQIEFAERGFDGATVAGIVRRAGLSKGTFYFNFDSKDDLIAQLLAERLDEPATSVATTARDGAQGERLGTTISRHLADQFTENPELLRLLHEYWLAATRDDELATRYVQRHDGVRSRVAETIGELLPDDGSDTVPAEDLAEAFIALAVGLGMTAVLDPSAVRPDLFGHLVTLVYDGILAGIGRTTERRESAVGRGGSVADMTDPEATETETTAERIEVQRPIAAAPSDIFAVLASPDGHVRIDASGMLMSASGDPVRAVGDTFTVHMDRDALNDYPLGLYDVEVEITTFEQDREIAWTIHGAIKPSIGHIYGYRLEEIDTPDGAATMVTSYYDWSQIDETWKSAGIFPVISETNQRATLGILARTVAPGKARPQLP